LRLGDCKSEQQPWIYFDTLSFNHYCSEASAQLATCSNPHILQAYAIFYKQDHAILKSYQ